MSFIESVDSESVDDVVGDSEIVLEPLLDEGLCDTLIVPVAVQCIVKDRSKDTLVFSFHDPGYEDGLKIFISNKIGPIFYFFTTGSYLNTDLGLYLGVFFNKCIKNILFVRSRPLGYQISKDVEYRSFLKSVMENFAMFPLDLLFDLKFSTIFTQESDDSVWISNEERHNFSYPKLVKVNSAKG